MHPVMQDKKIFLLVKQILKIDTKQNDRKTKIIIFNLASAFFDRRQTHAHRFYRFCRQHARPGDTEISKGAPLWLYHPIPA